MEFNQTQEFLSEGSRGYRLARSEIYASKQYRAERPSPPVADEPAAAAVKPRWRASPTRQDGSGAKTDPPPKRKKKREPEPQTVEPEVEWLPCVDCALLIKQNQQRGSQQVL